MTGLYDGRKNFGRYVQLFWNNAGGQRQTDGQADWLLLAVARTMEMTKTRI